MIGAQWPAISLILVADKTFPAGAYCGVFALFDSCVSGSYRRVLMADSAAMAFSGIDNDDRRRSIDR